MLPFWVQTLFKLVIVVAFILISFWIRSWIQDVQLNFFGQWIISFVSILTGIIMILGVIALALILIALAIKSIEKNKKQRNKRREI